MKKLLIGLSVLFLMSGCGTETKNLSCSSTTTTNGITTNTKYDIKYENDVVKYITITNDYNQSTNNNETIDGTNADTDGLDKNDDNNNDNALNADDVVDGVVGDTIDTTINGITNTILDLAGIKNTYQNQMSTYDGIEGFTYSVDVDSDNEYKVIYKIDMDKINDDDLNRFNVGRDLSDLRTNYENSGYTCE